MILFGDVLKIYSWIGDMRMKETLGYKKISVEVSEVDSEA